MIYPETFEQKLGFDRILEMLSNYCLSSLGRQQIEDMRFSSDFDTLTFELSLTEDLFNILRFEENFPQDNYIDCTPSLNKITIEGSFMDIEEVNNLRKSIQTLKELSRYFRQDLIKEKYPTVSKEFHDLEVFPIVGENIDRIINNHGAIRDNASQELREIRSRIKQKQTAVNRKLHNILKKGQQDGWVEPDVEISLRNGRPVIPVGASYKRKLGGLVHDESASGKTAFIEPHEVVEMNNELRELDYSERREITKILIEFASQIRPHILEMLSMYFELGRIDFLQAKGKLAIRLNSIKPILHEKKYLEWKNAVHPLLFLSHQNDKKEIVPLDIKLNNQNRLLLISGPNAGGKSVCLKTVGLLQYMLQCGLLVPMSENSEVCLFESIFLDIGDEQSLENDLSTYSSHLLNMKQFVRHANSSSMVLIDEFGTGTEPALGGAIAEALLARLNETEVFGLITTHYANLKHFASENQGIINGAMLFDTQKIKPLYKLSMGEPGSSFAIDIARSIGLPETILKRASEIVGEDYVNFEKHLRDIIRDKKYWEEKRKKIRSVEKTLEQLYSRYGEELQNMQKERKAILKEAKNEAEFILKDANKAIEKTIREIKEGNADKERTRRAREKFREEQKNLTTSDNKDDNIETKIREVKNAGEKLYRHNPDLKPKKPKNQTDKKRKDTDNIEIGDKVRMLGVDTPGEVIEKNGNQFVIAFGNMLTNLDASKLEKIGASGQSPQPHITPRVKSNLSERKLGFKAEIDVRGKRADEALKTVQDFLDDALMMNAKRLSIIHGKGNGILRELIHDYLKTLSDVQKVSDANADRGGTGISLIELR